MRKLEHYSDHELMVAYHTNENMERPHTSHLPEFQREIDADDWQSHLTMWCLEHIIIREEMRSRWLVAHGGRA